MTVEHATRALERKLQENSRDFSDFREIKVPSRLRDVNKEDYEPEVVSIGPNYHGRDELKEMEIVKATYMRLLLERKPDVKLEDYIISIEPEVRLAQDCYAEDLMLDRDEFFAMLVLDGCFIIQFIAEYYGQHATYIRSTVRYRLTWDLLLLENQIPFFVLRKLFDIIYEPDDTGSLLMLRVLKLFRWIFPGGVLNEDDTLKKKPEKVTHILDLMHFSWCSSFQLELPVSDPTYDIITSPFEIPSASRLKFANVKFKKKSFDKSDNLFDVKFEDGKLELPMLVIGVGTKSLLRNLIAYEQLLPSDKPAPFTDYALLLDNLINNATDVKILSKYGIIHHVFDSNKAAADYVNQLTYKIIYSNSNFKYSDIFRRINAHYKKRIIVGSLNMAIERHIGIPVAKAVADFRKKYFNSLWSFIGAVAATVLLLLTAAQTIFAALEHFQRP